MENPVEIYDLEERGLKFARDIRIFIKVLPKTINNIDDLRQLSRASGSIGANYIEANESLGKKDFVMRAKISRKEAKETIYWLHLIDTQTKEQEITRHKLIAEATELLKILSAIIVKSS